MYKFYVFILAMLASMVLTQSTSSSAVMTETNLTGLQLSMESRFHSNPSELTASGGTNNSITLNGSSLRASKGTDMDDYLDATYEEIAHTFARFVSQHNLNGTTANVILDMEAVVAPKHWGTFLASSDDDSDGSNNNVSHQFTQIITAYKLRVSVARALLPHAKICLYGMPVPTSASFHSRSWLQQVEGFTKAGQLGVFDQADYIVPVCYQRYCHNDFSNYMKKNKEMTTTAIQTARTFVNTSGHHIPVLPLITPTLFNGGSHCNNSLITPAHLWKQIKWLKALNVEHYGLWIGKQNIPYSQLTIHQYLGEVLQVSNQNGSGY